MTNLKLSNQAVGSLLMTLQKCLSEQLDITDMLKDWVLEVKDTEIFVVNPPIIETGITPTAEPQKPVFDVR
jgi:hypothetical protein|tara:strand:+ start:388 stop:600 length:213 start_codon:yes stop_codon:yes gene_type:complete